MKKRNESKVKLAHLRTFVAIADSGGVGRAAAPLNLTQSAASRQIIALEAELGLPLFDRIGRRVQLTSGGEDLLRRSQGALQGPSAPYIPPDQQRPIAPAHWQPPAAAPAWGADDHPKSCQWLTDKSTDRWSPAAE